MGFSDDVSESVPCVVRGPSGPVARGPQTETCCCSPETCYFYPGRANRLTAPSKPVFCRVDTPQNRNPYGWNVLYPDSADLQLTRKRTNLLLSSQFLGGRQVQESEIGKKRWRGRGRGFDDLQCVQAAPLPKP
jgi:hypothetical protein